MIYFDNSATTKMYVEALQIYNKYNQDNFYNSAALYNAADFVSSAINRARGQVAAGLNADSKNLVFVSGGTEANNLAIKGYLSGQKKGRIVCGMGEHASVYNVFRSYEESGQFTVAYAPLGRCGEVDKAALQDLVTEDTVLVSIMHVCNETGAVNNIAEITKMIREKSPKCCIHADGVQAYGKINVDIKRLGCDLYSISAHKHHGPKGVGALYIAPHIKLKPLFHGGGQENNIRSGTHNSAAIAAYGCAAEQINTRIDSNIKHCSALKDKLWSTLSGEVLDIRLNSDINSSPNILSVSIKNIPAEVLVTILETRGILVGTGSACSSKKGYSRIHQAMGMDKAYSMGTVRFSFCEFNTIDEVNTVATEVIKAAADLRKVCKKQQ